MSKGNEQPYLINPISARVRAHKVAGGSRRRARTASKEAKMARKKLYGAALSAHLKRIRKGRKNPGPKAIITHKRKRHVVVKHHRKGGHVVGYNRHGASVKQHMSNPLRRRSYRRNPAFGLGNVGATTMDAVIIVTALLGTVVAVGFINRQVLKVPMLQAGWGSVMGKLAVAIGVTMVATKFVKNKNLQLAITAGCFLPPVLSAVGVVAPNIAGLVGGGLAQEEDSLEAQLRAQLAAPQGIRVTDKYLGLGEEEGRLETDRSMF